jgi:hypothetical protein
VVGAFPDLIDVHLGLCLDIIFQKEMQIVSEHEYRDTELRQFHQHGFQESQGNVEKGCLF